MIPPILLFVDYFSLQDSMDCLVSNMLVIFQLEVFDCLFLLDKNNQHKNQPMKKQAAASIKVGYLPELSCQLKKYCYTFYLNDLGAQKNSSKILKIYENFRAVFTMKMRMTLQ